MGSSRDEGRPLKLAKMLTGPLEPKSHDTFGIARFHYVSSDLWLIDWKAK